MTKIGFIIQLARAESGETLREVDEATGVAYAAISRIERGRIREPSFSAVVKLARHLKIDIRKLAETI